MNASLKSVLPTFSEELSCFCMPAESETSIYIQETQILGLWYENSMMM